MKEKNKNRGWAIIPFILGIIIFFVGISLLVKASEIELPEDVFSDDYFELSTEQGTSILFGIFLCAVGVIIDFVCLIVFVVSKFAKNRFENNEEGEFDNSKNSTIGNPIGKIVNALKTETTVSSPPAQEPTNKKSYSFCEYCGTKVFENEKKCSGCGARITQSKK